MKKTIFTIGHYSKLYLEIIESLIEKQDYLEGTLIKLNQRIQYLDKIYQDCSGYSRYFTDCAYIERQELCKKTSAIYSLLREMKD